MKHSSIVDSLKILGLSDRADLEAIRREFARKYNALEEFSLNTSSALLKEQYEQAMDLLTKAYCTILGVDSIKDMLDLMAFSKSVVVDHLKNKNKISADPFSAQLIFGMLYMHSTEDLTHLYTDIKEELEAKMSTFDLESSKFIFKKEIALLTESYNTCLKYSVQYSLSALRIDIQQKNPILKMKNLLIGIGFTTILIALVVYWILIF